MLVRARRAGLIAWEQLRDDTATAATYTTWVGVEAYLTRAADYARQHPHRPTSWGDGPVGRSVGCGDRHGPPAHPHLRPVRHRLARPDAMLHVPAPHI